MGVSVKLKKKKKVSSPKKITKDKKPTKLKEIRLKFKKWQEMEKEKKELKKQDINNSIKPKGYVARKTGVVSFWVLFSFMFLVVVVTMFSGDSKATADKTVEVEENYATSPEAIQFAENFLEDYFTWTETEENKEVRKQKMMKYVAEELRDHRALDIRSNEWNSVFKSAELKKITEKGDNLAYITFLVNFEFEKVKQDKKDKKPEVKQLQKYISVPVAYDKHSFGIYELPKFTYIYEDETTLDKVQYPKLEQADVEVVERIREFLPTFFKTYAEDEKEKLNYMIKNENVTNGLNGTMQFESIESLQAFNGKKKNHYIVYTEIKLIEPETNIPFFATHQLEIMQQEDRLIVSGMNNQEIKGVVSTIEGEESDGNTQIDTTEGEPVSSEESQQNNTPENEKND